MVETWRWCWFTFSQGRVNTWDIASTLKVIAQLRLSGKWNRDGILRIGIRWSFWADRLDRGMQRELKKGKYRHFKGNEYQVVDVARCSETDAPYVIYKPLYNEGEGLWVRPLEMFLETIEREGKTFERFEYIGD